MFIALRFRFLIFKCLMFLCRKLWLETDPDPVTHSCAAPVGSFTKAVTFTWQVVRDELSLNRPVVLTSAAPFLKFETVRLPPVSRFRFST